MHTYRNPWFTPGSHDPEFYRTDAKPKQIGKYQCFYRIKDSKPSRRCYDYVLNDVVVTQRCGGGLTEAELDAYMSERNLMRALATLSPRAVRVTNSGRTMILNSRI